MSKVKVIAFEDDPLHKDILQMNLENLGYKSTGIYSNSTDAIKLIAATKPDIILMDIDLGGGENGVQLTEKINATFNIPVIYISSSFDKYTLKKVKETSPEAYLTKPYTVEQLKVVIELALSNYEAAIFPSQHKDSTSVDCLFVKEHNHFTKLLYQEILFFEAYDKYCFAHTRQKKILLSTQMKTLLQRLPSNFLQVHRSFIINADMIDKIRTNQHNIEINPHHIIPYSKSYRADLFKRLNIL